MQGGKFLNFKDMFDGGGAGAAGKEFAGGGLLSDIANQFFTPFGQGRRMQEAMQSTRPQMRPQQPTMSGQGQPPAPAPQPTGRSPFEMFGGQPAAPYSAQGGPGISPYDMFGGQPASPYTRAPAPVVASAPPQQPIQPTADPMAPYMAPPNPDALPVQPMGSMTGLPTPGSMTAPGYMGHPSQTQMSPEMFQVMKYLLEQK